jgi:hypothetical protein
MMEHMDGILLGVLFVLFLGVYLRDLYKGDGDD